VGFRVETVMLGPDTEQYAGEGQAPLALAEIAAASKRAEALGFDGLTAPEAGHDPFLPLAIAAEHTTRIRLGTNVAIAFPRSPMATAQVAWDLQRLSGGRFRLGLGTQVKAHNERRYGAPWTAAPGPRMREYVQCLRAIWKSFQDGKSPEYFKGAHYQFTLLPPFFNPGPIEHAHVPIDLAAVNRYMARTAGELCDGLRLHPISTFRHTREVILPAIAEGAHKAGRSPSEIDLIAAPFLATGRDEAEVEKAKQALKQRIAFYASTPTYHSVLEFHGWMDLAQQLHRLSREGKWREMATIVRDDMLEEWAVIATFDRLAETVAARCRDFAGTLMLDLPPALHRDEARVREIVQALHRA
jgi:probable F420-dependent oxidoreductase